MASQTYQITFHMGSNTKGKEVQDLLETNKKKFGAANDSETIRIALRVLDKLDKTDPLLKNALQSEG